MTIRKNLASILLAGTLALAGCKQTNNHPVYHYNGKLDGEQITLYEPLLQGLNEELVLKVTRTNETRIIYSGDVNGLKRLKIIRKDGNIMEYPPLSEDEIFQEARKQYTNYLTKILDINTRKAIQDIREEK